MGNVWRADRPQRGRFRQFMQCDIDILGEPSNLAEIELILATTTLLGKLDFKNFTIRINDRKILKSNGGIQRISGREIMTRYLSFWIRWTRSVWTVWQKNWRRCGYAAESALINIYRLFERDHTMMWQVSASCKEKLEGLLLDGWRQRLWRRSSPA